jgi:hypothetical protein
LIQESGKIGAIIFDDNDVLIDLDKWSYTTYGWNKITKQRKFKLIVCIFSYMGKITTEYYLDWYRWAGGICLDKRRIYNY